MSDPERLHAANRRQPAEVVPLDFGGHRERVLRERNERIEKFIADGHLDRIARQELGGMPPCYTLDDLISAGNIGLTLASSLYRPNHHSGASFETYAERRVRGSMKELVRRRDLQESSHVGLEEVEHSAPEASSDAEPWENVLRSSKQRVRHLTGADDLEVSIDRAERLGRMKQAIARFEDPIERLVMETYYFDPDEPSLAKVAKIVGKSQTTVVQMKDRGIERLVNELREA